MTGRLARCGGACLALLALITAPREAAARTLVVGRDAPSLEVALEISRDRDIIEVRGGVHRGHFRVERSVVIHGRDATLDGGGEGTVLTIAAPRVVVDGMRIVRSGEDLGAPDAGIYLSPEATDAVIEGNYIEDCAFGIWVHETARARLLRNTVIGRSEVRPADRGNGIHLFDASHLEVRGNRVREARDGIYVSATEDSRIVDNVLEDQRYGIHYMYSHRNLLRGNHSVRSVSGIALMQSYELEVIGNEASENDRHGILFRDVQYSTIRGNRLVRNGEGMFFFSSTDNQIVHNEIIQNEVGAKVWAGSLRNAVRENAFVGNGQQIFFVGAEDLFWGVDGRGNFWSDYVGWDQDDDGVGDRPYRVDSFTSTLLYRFPSVALLLRSPALELLTHLESRMLLLRKATVVDRAPLLRGAFP